MNNEKPITVFGKEVQDTLNGMFTRAAHKDFDEEIERRTQEMQRQKDEVLEKRLKAQKGPKINVEGKPAFGTVANALKGFYPQANRAQRRQMVKNSRKKGKGYNK